MVVRALTSHGIAQKVVGQEFGVSGAMIGHIRNGTYHAKVRPDLTRWRSCEQCGFWVRRCTLDFPEPEELGLWATASDCSAYVKR